MIKVAVCGAAGKMGKTVTELLAEDNGAEIFCGVDPGVDPITGNTVDGVKIYKSFAEMASAETGSPDVIIDFSSPAALESELEYAVKYGVPAVIGTTGFTAKQLEKIQSASSRVAIFETANFSLGVNLMCKLVRQTAAILGEKFDVEIIEKHHANKADAPSGTAIMLAESVNRAFENKRTVKYGRAKTVEKRGNEICIHAVRGGTVVGEHEAGFYGKDEIITLTHSASSKRVFASGAIAACKWLCGKPAGKYDMTDLLNF